MKTYFAKLHESTYTGDVTGHQVKHPCCDSTEDEAARLKIVVVRHPLQRVSAYHIRDRNQAHNLIED
mgnify:CR=1 FL=1